MMLFLENPQQLPVMAYLLSQAVQASLLPEASVMAQEALKAATLLSTWAVWGRLGS